MIRYRSCKIASVGVLVWVVCLLTSAGAAEIRRPDVNKMFGQTEEATIRSLRSQGPQEVFDRLKSSEFLANRDLAYKAVYVAFGHRRAQAFAHAENCLREPLVEVVEGRYVTRVREFNMAKKVFEVFPDEAVPRLLALYQRSDAITRGNILRAAHGIDGGPPIQSMLAQALDDPSAAEEEGIPEQLGAPLRVCDIAYNQLVLRNGVRNVLRTISPGHKIEIRDYHISILKDRLGLDNI